MIKAELARKFSSDILNGAKELSEQVVKEIEEHADAMIAIATNEGKFQCEIALTPIVALNKINREASKRAVMLLDGLLQSNGYKHVGFTNRTEILTIRWDR